MDPDVITLDMARNVLAETDARWASLLIRPIRSSGTDNALFLLGTDHVLRLPKHEEAAGFLEKELEWLPKLKDLPLEVPQLTYRSQMKSYGNRDFGIFKWIDGAIALDDKIADPCRGAHALAMFLNALHQFDTRGAPIAGIHNNNRGIALPQLSDKVVSGIQVVSDEVDAPAAMAIWDLACDAAEPRHPVWVHGDLKADNLIASDGELVGVIDWGLSAVGDPAVDFAAAWTWVDLSARQAFRDCLSICDADWDRAKGWALYCAIIALSFYRGKSHADLCNQSRLTLYRLGVLR